jgi:hypothetical protein
LSIKRASASDRTASDKIASLREGFAASSL